MALYPSASELVLLKWLPRGVLAACGFGTAAETAAARRANLRGWWVGWRGQGRFFPFWLLFFSVFFLFFFPLGGAKRRQKKTRCNPPTPRRAHRRSRSRAEPTTAAADLSGLRTGLGGLADRLQADCERVAPP